MSKEAQEGEEILNNLSPEIWQKLKELVDQLQLLQQEYETVIDANGRVLANKGRAKELDDEIKEVSDSMQKLLHQD